MKNELAVMLSQWANANVPLFGFTPYRAHVSQMQIADEDLGEDGGFFTLYEAVLPVTPGLRDINLTLGQRLRELERTYAKVCFDIWLKKGCAVKGTIKLL